MEPLRAGWRWAPFVALGSVAALGLRVDVMDIDAAQYAELARQMLESGSFLQIKAYAGDYLDKPHLVFWAAAASYALFGVSTAAYKLPSLLFALLAVYATGRLGRLLYSREAGYTAALVLASCQAFFTMTNDCRTDALLMGAVSLAVWQLAAFVARRRLRHLLLGALGVGLGMLAKGLLGLAVPAAALGAHLALRRDWQPLRRWEWGLGLGVVGVLLAPALYGLYAQFGTAGLAFHFWTQGPGRLTGASPWRDDSTPLYFVTTLAWAFLPWTPALVLALHQRFAALFRQRLRLRRSQEFIAAGGLAITFLALSLLRYKLSHYVYVLMPFAALLTGQYLASLARQGRSALAQRRVARLGAVVCAGMWAVAWLLGGYLFGPLDAPVAAAALLAMLLAALVYAGSRAAFARIVLAPVCTMIGVNVLLGAHVSPRILGYQASSQAAHRFVAEGLPRTRLYAYRTRPHALSFYTQRGIRALHSPGEVAALRAAGELWLYTDERGLRELREAGLPLRETRSFRHFPVTRLNPRFLDPATRESKLQTHHLVAIPAQTASRVAAELAVEGPAGSTARRVPQTPSAASSSSRLPSGSRK